MVLNWPAAAGALEYRIFRSPDGKGGSYRQIARVGKDTLTYTDEAVSNGVTYHYQVEALYASLMLADVYAGPLTVSVSSGSSRAPGAVRNLTATRRANETTIDVTWDAPSSNATGGTRYNVEYRSREGVSGAWSDWAEVVTEQADLTPYTLTGGEAGTSYEFRVCTVNLAGNEKRSGGCATVTARSLPAGAIAGVLAARVTGDITTINVSWPESARATGYDVEYRINEGSWRRAASNQTGLVYRQTGADDSQEEYTFRVRGVADAGPGEWTESAEVPAPPVGYHGYEVGPTVADGKMAWITLKVTGGPWWLEYRSHRGWSSCIRVAGGSRAITNLHAPFKHIVEIFDASGCADGDRIERLEITTIDVADPILDRADFNRHTHKRRYPAYGEVGVKPSDCSMVEQHSHGWPDTHLGGLHWHCPIYNDGSSPSIGPPQTNPPQGSATGQAGGAQGQSGQTAGGGGRRPGRDRADGVGGGDGGDKRLLQRHGEPGRSLRGAPGLLRLGACLSTGSRGRCGGLGRRRCWRLACWRCCCPRPRRPGGTARRGASGRRGLRRAGRWRCRCRRRTSGCSAKWRKRCPRGSPTWTPACRRRGCALRAG